MIFQPYQWNTYGCYENLVKIQPYQWATFQLFVAMEIE